MSFRLWTVFYVFSLIAVAMATFGPAGGAFAAACVLGFWMWVFYCPKTRFGLLELLIIIIVICLLAALLLPAVQSVRARSRSASCSNNMKQLGLAILAYDASYGKLPPPFFTDDVGSPLLSWRALILPYIERRDMFDTVEWTEAWDSAKNSKWSSAGLEIYRCPSDAAQGATTNYFAVVDPRTAWPPTGVRTMSGFKDGREQTILLIEARGRKVAWAEPRDLSFEEAVDLLSTPIESDDGHRIHHGFFYKPTIGRNVLFADGRAQLISVSMDRDLAEALLTMNGSDSIDLRTLRQATEPQLDYAKCYAFGIFIILSLLPAAWARRGTTAKRSFPQDQQCRIAANVESK